MKRNDIFSFSILKAFGIPPEQLEVATKYLSDVILVSFLRLVEEEGREAERKRLTRALSKFKEKPELFTSALSEVLANNQTLQERAAKMINNLYSQLIETFEEHASPDEKERYREWVSRQ